MRILLLTPLLLTGLLRADCGTAPITQSYDHCPPLSAEDGRLIDVAGSLVRLQPRPSLTGTFSCTVDLIDGLDPLIACLWSGYDTEPGRSASWFVPGARRQIGIAVPWAAGLPIWLRITAFDGHHDQLGLLPLGHDGAPPSHGSSFR
jgi:hypothetical protein